MGFACFFLKEKIRSNSKKTNKVESSNSSTTTTYVCRDELDNKKKSKMKKQVKFDLQPKYQREDIDENANTTGVKVKMLMKKEDAARLLLKRRDGGVLEFMDVAHELVSSSNVRVIISQ
ncbi:hypothetical protein P3L10_000151 [Capsicum annuum]